jgi:hypothetical protein
MDETRSLINQIRDKLDADLLPQVLPEKVRAGRGHGNSCNACDRAVLGGQLEYRFLTQDDSDKPLRFHFACLGLWLAALRRRGIEVGRFQIEDDAEDVPA